MFLSLSIKFRIVHTHFLWEIVLNGILDYVFSLSINYMLENEHVKRIKFEFNTMLEH
jgi:hypothetical protein